MSHPRACLTGAGRVAARPLASSIFEPLEDRTLYSAAAVRSIDGTGNNLLNPSWGGTDTALLRLAAAQYADGVSAPAGASRPSGRVISNAVAAHPADEETLSAN